MADKNFYRAFEDVHRGSRELIKSRLSIYLPFIHTLRPFFTSGQGIDLGCGRGEWLELMRENGIEILGVDLDEGMLEASRTIGLNVVRGDAIQKLQSLETESQMLVSGFHIAEHLTFEVLQILMQESLRVLKPGGLLILETPNPENIVVGTANFYLDPTHQRPIPSQLLSFMAEYFGFAKVKTMRLQEMSELSSNSSPDLYSVLSGVSPDYAVVSQKSGPSKIMGATNAAFEAEYGLSLAVLAARYEQRIQQIQNTAQQAKVALQQTEVALTAIYSSRSWRITEPLRKFSSYMKGDK